MSRRLRTAIVNVLFLGIILGIVAACAGPRGAPLATEITKQKKGDPVEFAVYQVSKDTLPRISKWPGDPKANRHWLSGGYSGRLAIRPGDRVNLVIWDNDSNSLLTSVEQKNVSLEGIVVSPSGDIFMPYLDKIHIAGLSPDAARQKVQRQMEQIVPSAQVQLSMVPGTRQAVDIVGGVATPGNYPLTDPDGQTTVLGLISRAGGVKSDLDNPQVTLTRGSKVYRIALKRLYENPRLDSILRGRDKVIVASDTRYFRSLGASQKEAIVPFDRETISALDAMSMIGGLRDLRADPQGILILREYPADVVKRKNGPEHNRVIFSIDLTKTDGLFSADKFLIHPRDTVMVTESPVLRFRAIIGLFSDSFRTITRGQTAF